LLVCHIRAKSHNKSTSLAGRNEAFVLKFLTFNKSKDMKRLLAPLTLLVFFLACQENDVANEFTGNETTFELAQASTYSVNGFITFREKTDGSAIVNVELTGTEGPVEHPVHLHLGNVSTPDAEVAALLNPVIGNTGISETHLDKLADESSISYQQLLELNACIKIHLSASGTNKNIILAAGNIGNAKANESSSGRQGIAICK
jgi:hypothetical protein